jgi:hypothetical protein
VFLVIVCPKANEWPRDRKKSFIAATNRERIKQALSIALMRGNFVPHGISTYSRIARILR